MREYSVPGAVSVGATDNLTDAVFTAAADAPDTVVLARKVAGRWVDVSAAQFAAEVRGLAKGLVAAGVRPGERVALVSRTRYEWTLVDYAIWTAGAVSVPIYETSSAEQVAWIVGDSDAVAVIVETAAHRATYDEVAAQLPAVREVWRIDAGDLDRLTAAGADVADDMIDERRRTVTPDTLATILYTSGTTGLPKGCALTHGNFLFDARSATGALPELFAPGASTLLFLPLAHVFARLIEIGCLEKRVRLGHTADIKNLAGDLAGFQPSFVLSVPRVFEKIYNSAKAKADSAGKGRIFDRAAAVAVQWSEAVDRGRPGPLLATQHAVFDRLVYARLRAALGGAVQYAISGGAPLGARLGHFFRGIGVTVLEGYGLTESTAGACVNLPTALRIGTVGRPVPGTAVRITDDDEILLHGPHIFRGYWRNETATKEVLEPDGWLHTGDLGELDDDGYLRITGRRKEIIVTAGGKNVSPAVLEDRLRSHPLVSPCMVVGDARPYVGCLITLDADSLAAWKKDKGKPEAATVAELRDDPDLRAELDAAVESANKAVSRAEGIRRYRVLDVDFTEDGGHLTPTLKVKRNVVAAQFADDIDALYA